MGLLSGGLNGRRYRITTPLPEGFRDLYLEQVREAAFTPAPVAGDREPRVGWCDPFEAANTSFELNTFLFDRYVVLTARIDKKTVNARYLKIAVTERTLQVMEERGTEKLSKDDRGAIAEAVEAELYSRALPSVNLCDVAWDIHTGEVLIFATSDATLELVELLFEETFGVNLHRERMADWLSDKLEWGEIAERADAALSGARGTQGQGHVVDGWHQDDPLEGAHMELAADFVTWLWLQSESSDGLFRVIEEGPRVSHDEDVDDEWNDVTESLKHGQVVLWLESRLKLQDIHEEEAPETTILLGVAPSTTTAARLDLSNGKRPVEARIGLRVNELECGMTLRATPGGVDVSGLKMPFEVKKGEEEKVFERMALLDLVHTTVKRLFQQFFLSRTTEAWQGRVERWLQDDLAAK